MPITLFWGSGSTPSWRVMLALEHKRLAYDSRLIQFSKREHKTPEFLAMNPRGQVPTLLDDGEPIYESLAILAYLDRKYPELPIFGRTPSEHALIWRTIASWVYNAEPELDRAIGPVLFGGATEPTAEGHKAMSAVHDELAHVEDQLGAGSWLCGELPSAADFVVFPDLQMALRAAGKPNAPAFELGLVPLGERYPGLAAWCERIAGLPGYERTYPPHWRAA